MAHTAQQSVNDTLLCAYLHANACTQFVSRKEEMTSLLFEPDRTLSSMHELVFTE